MLVGVFNGGWFREVCVARLCVVDGGLGWNVVVQGDVGGQVLVLWWMVVMGGMWWFREVCGRVGVWRLRDVCGCSATCAQWVVCGRICLWVVCTAV